MDNNRQYNLIHDAAMHKAEKLDPKLLASLTGFALSKEGFETTTLGTDIKISLPGFKITPEINIWQDLTILQYLANAKGAELTGQYISLSEFHSGGLARGTSFDRENDRIISSIGNHSEESIKSAAAKLGAIELKENSDLAFLFYFLPRVPIKLKLWLSDEDFPASGKLLFDSSSEIDLEVEAAGTAGTVLLNLLYKELIRKP